MAANASLGLVGPGGSDGRAIMFGGLTSARSKRRGLVGRVTQVLLLSLFASVFVAVPNAYAGGITLSVNEWDVNKNTCP